MFALPAGMSASSGFGPGDVRRRVHAAVAAEQDDPARLLAHQRGELVDAAGEARLDPGAVAAQRVRGSLDAARPPGEAARVPVRDEQQLRRGRPEVVDPAAARDRRGSGKRLGGEQ